MKKNRFEIYFALGLFLLCFALQNTAIFVEKLVDLDVSWNKKDEVITADISHLKNDSYFVSLGKPRGHCDIFLDGKTLFTGKGGVPDKRISLLVGGSFVKDDSSKSITIDCRHEMTGWKLYLAHSPFIATYNSGMIVHMIRAISEIAIGPFASLIMFLMLMYARFTVGAHIRKSEWFFASAALAYSLSLSYYTRLFMTGADASVAHILLRFVFSYSAYCVLNSGLKNRTSVLVHHAAVFALAIIWVNDPVDLMDFYKYAHPSLLIPFALSLHDRLKQPIRDRKHLYLTIFAIGWIMAQSLDAINLWANFGIYNSPMLIMVLSLTYGMMVLETHRTSKKLNNLQNRLSEALKNEADLSGLLKSIKDILALDTSFNQITAYIDGTLNGKADRERTILSPVVGHRTDDVSIDTEGSGLYMTQALDSGEIVMAKGNKDGMWFLVAPIGRYCCINFTTNEKLTEYLVLETRDLMLSLLPTLDTAISKIIELSHRQGSSLQRLRSIIGPGSHEKQTAAIFVDIADYSKYTESLGNEYTGFISQTYLPSLIKILAPWATPEVVRGDEIYFVVLKELSKEESSLNTIAACALKRLQQFVSEDGKKICKSNGFPTVDLRIGMTCGDANIVVDDIQVRTSGDHINRAKRLQDSAEKNEAWVDAATAESLASEGIIVLKKKTIIVKKNIIEAVKVGVKRAA